MTPHDRFLKLIKDFLGGERDELRFVKNEFVVDADGPVHLALSAEREEIIVSTMVFSAVDQPELVRPDSIAQFNAYHLFHGGYRLSVAAQPEFIYVSQTKALARLEAIGLSAFFEDFIARCASCSRWYLAETPPLVSPEELEAMQTAELAPTA